MGRRKNLWSCRVGKRARASQDSLDVGFKVERCQRAMIFLALVASHCFKLLHSRVSLLFIKKILVPFCSRINQRIYRVWKRGGGGLSLVLLDKK